MIEDKVRNIKIADFEYRLPDSKVAKYPLHDRDRCKLLVYDGASIKDKSFFEIPELLPKGSLLVYNDSRVINARIIFRKGEQERGAKIEIFCLEPFNPGDYALNFASKESCEWKCFVGNSKKWKDNEPLSRSIKYGDLSVKIIAERVKKEEGYSIIKFSWDSPQVVFSEIIESIGVIPIPPYLNRDSESTDIEDYQTVYSEPEGSVAAPTAGLHFTEKTLSDLDRKGIKRAQITLHVGAGTFKPVNSERIGEHDMHKEFFSVSKKLIKDIIRAKSPGSFNEIIAVGTTAVRVLESLYYAGCLIYQGNWSGTVPQWYAYSENLPKLTLTESLNEILNSIKSGNFIGETQLLIAPGFKFRIINGMITNFHQPGSTLLLLVSAFLKSEEGGTERWKDIYNHALDNGYRFLSYGDACLFL